jgi:leucyl-tRNA synthetase
MNFVMAPVIPHLAEEIHESLNETESSVFMTVWEPQVSFIYHDVNVMIRLGN